MDKATRELFSPKSEKTHQRDAVEKVRDLFTNTSGARERIARLSDYGRLGGKVEDEVKNLGLKYHLMTQYTSFVAVDTIVRDTGELVTVKQPLPLPEGLSDYAVGINRGRVDALPFSGLVKMLSVKDEADYHLQDQERERGPSRIYLMGGKLPPGITMG